jgi:hypothetical protein
VREALVLHPGDAVFFAVVDGELRLSKSADPYAHLSDDELLAADHAWLEELPEEVIAIQKEVALWDNTLMDGLWPGDEGDGATGAP